MKKLWDSRFVDERGALESVSAEAGWVMAVGRSLICRLRPGRNTAEIREHPRGDDSMVSVAIEPGKPHRAGVLSLSHLVVFDPSRTERYAHIDFKPGTPEGWEVAWGKVAGKRTLHMLNDEYEVLRFGDESETLGVEHVVRMVNGHDGSLALLTGGDEPRFYVTTDGLSFQYRVLADAVSDETSVEIAIDGASAAFSADETLWVSRARDEAFELIEDLERPGPIAFDDKGGLFVVEHEDDGEVIVRVDALGHVTRVTELAATGTEPPRIVSIVWDATRKALWSASTHGLLITSAPTSEVLLS